MISVISTNLLRLLTHINAYHARYFAYPGRTLTQTFDFLGVPRPPSDVWTAMLANLSASEARSSHASSTKRTFMRSDTADLLREFFAPFESELVEMISGQKGS